MRSSVTYMPSQAAGIALRLPCDHVGICIVPRSGQAWGVFACVCAPVAIPSGPPDLQWAKNNPRVGRVTSKAFFFCFLSITHGVVSSLVWKEKEEEEKAHGS